MKSKDQPPRRFDRALWLTILVITLGVALMSFPRDDGLRHVGLAFSPERSWGQVYPFSTYERFSSVNPWYGHDLTLRGLARLCALLPGHALAARFVLIKLLLALLVGSLLLISLWRSKISAVVVDGHSFTTALLLLLLVLCWPILRAITVRPVIFGTLFLLYAVGARGAVSGLISSAALFFFYPYLAWMYTLPAALAQLLRGCRAFAAGAILATVGALSLLPRDFWELILEVARSGQRRALLNSQITEFVSAFSQPGLVLFFVVGWLVLVTRLSRTNRGWAPVHLVMLLFLPISLLHIRYFIDVLLPLLFVAYAAPATRLLLPPFKRTLTGWAGIFGGLMNRQTRSAAPTQDPPAPASDPPAPASRRRSLMWLILPLYGLVFALIGLRGCENYRALAAEQQTLAVIPRGSLALTEFNLQYRLLFLRPDLRLIPSSELGFFAPRIKEEYLRFFNQGDVCSLAHRVKARFFVDGRGIYLDPQQVGCLRLVREQEKLRIWRIEPNS